MGEVQLSTALCDLKIAVWGQTDVFYSSNTSPIRLGTLGSGVMVHVDGHEWWQQKSCPNHVQRQIEDIDTHTIGARCVQALQTHIHFS